jgi:hypothetical protein
VAAAHQADVVAFSPSPQTEGMPMVVFEAVSLRASPSLGIDEAALASVASIDEAANVEGKVS